LSSDYPIDVKTTLLVKIQFSVETEKIDKQQTTAAKGKGSQRAFPWN